jgi:hypothetical protein
MASSRAAKLRDQASELAAAMPSVAERAAIRLLPFLISRLGTVETAFALAHPIPFPFLPGCASEFPVFVRHSASTLQST